jgi:hypothetical protein
MPNRIKGSIGVNTLDKQIALLARQKNAVARLEKTREALAGRLEKVDNQLNSILGGSANSRGSGAPNRGTTNRSNATRGTGRRGGLSDIVAKVLEKGSDDGMNVDEIVSKLTPSRRGDFKGDDKEFKAKVRNILYTNKHRFERVAGVSGTFTLAAQTATA